LSLQLLLIKVFVRFYRRSRDAVAGFKQAAEKSKLSFIKLAVCAWEMLF